MSETELRAAREAALAAHEAAAAAARRYRGAPWWANRVDWLDVRAQALQASERRKAVAHALYAGENALAPPAAEG